MDEVQKLLQQVRILEQAASEKTGTERQELQRAAAKVKMQIIKLLPQRGQQHEQGSKIPDWSEYFSEVLPTGFENYFDNYLTDEQKRYFDNLTDEQKRYFSPDKNIAHFDNAPSAPKQQQPAKAKDDDEAELRRRIYAALGIFY
ncbi:hypothetical protein MMN46_23930 [Escherichia coli]|uniref:hypothetical protein n=1 Tax=Escherichia coli TaxID=562 RepID=UPI001F13062A|nr:hypothetical protein [Escherichia coli]MCH6444645.1 hypothetical protein [Escherichia coli]